MANRHYGVISLIDKPKFKVFRLDGRFKAYNQFDVYIEPTAWPTSQRSDGYLELREWFWTNYGPGAEIDMFASYNPPERVANYKWAWHDKEFRLYLKDGVELTHFNLTWM